MLLSSAPIGRAYHPGDNDHPVMARCPVAGCGWWLSPGYPCPEEHGLPNPTTGYDQVARDWLNRWQPAGDDDANLVGVLARLLMDVRHETLLTCATIADTFVTPLDDTGEGYRAHEAAAETANELATKFRALATIVKQST